MQAWMISVIVHFGMTGRNCSKSPPKTVVIPPNGRVESRISFNIWFTASTQSLCYIGTSSHMMRETCHMRSANFEFFLMLQVEFANILIGILLSYHPSTVLLEFLKKLHREQFYLYSTNSDTEHYNRRFSQCQQAHSERRLFHEVVGMNEELFHMLSFAPH